MVDQHEIEIEEEMGELVQEMAMGATVNALPPSVPTNVQLGISVAVDCLKDGKEEQACAALKVAVKELE